MVNVAYDKTGKVTWPQFFSVFLSLKKCFFFFSLKANLYGLISFNTSSEYMNSET